MKKILTLCLIIVVSLSVKSEGSQFCSDEVNQNGFFLRKCAILPENTFGGSDNAVKSGVTFQYLIWFSLPEGATEVVITDIIPSELEILNTIPNADIDHTTNTVTYEVPEGTAANTAQSLAINVKFPPGITCSGTIASNKVEISADQLGTTLITNEIHVEAFAVNPFFISKVAQLPYNNQTGIYSGVINHPVTYLFSIGKQSQYRYSDIGQQSLSYITLTDIVHPLAVMVPESASCNGEPVDASQTGSDIVLDLTEFTLSGADLTPSLQCELKILYSESYFPLNTIVTNEAYFEGNSCGAISPVFSNTVHVELGEASAAGSGDKSVSIINPVSGCRGVYSLKIDNDGNVPLDNFIIEDILPPEVIVTSMVIFSWDNISNLPLKLFIDGSIDPFFDDLASNTLPSVVNTLPGGVFYEYSSSDDPITQFRIELGETDSPIGLGIHCRFYITFTVSDDPILPAGTIVTNTADFSYTFNQNPSTPVSEAASFEIESFQPKLCLQQVVCDPQNSYMYGDIVRYRLNIQSYGSELLTGAVVNNLLNDNLEYVGNESYYQMPGNTLWEGITSTHTGNNLSWSIPDLPPYCEDFNFWYATGCNSPGITSYFVEFDAKVKQDAPAGTIPNLFSVDGGNLPDPAVSNSVYIVINNVFGAQAEKFCSTDNGTTWQKNATVNPGDEVMYRLKFTNNSNYPVTEIVLLDLLPMNYSNLNDRMILDRDNNRGSQFGILYNDTDIPEITTNPGNLNFSPPAVSVDNNDNICTAELLYSPIGCNQPDWQGGTGKNVKFDFGDNSILPPGATLNCDFKIQIPESTPSGLMACNSFAVRSSGFFTIGGETITLDNIASESDVICLNYSNEQGNDLLCEEPVFFWTEQAGGNKIDLDYAWGNAVVTDADKNVYTTGGFSGTVNFPNGSVFSSTDIESKIFVAKQNEVGEFLWITELGDIGFNEGRSIAISPTGEVFVTGIKSFVYSFDGDVIPEAFVAKIDGTNGELILDPVTGFSYWPSAGNDIAIAMDGKVYITGYECTWLKGDNSPKTSYCGWDDVLIKKFDSDLNILSVSGIVNFGGNGIDVGNGIAVDQNGHIYITGFFEQTVNFNPDWQGTPAFETAIGGRDIFLVKLNQNFEFLWVATIGGEQEDVGSDLVIDESGYIYITGWVSKSSVNVEGFDILHNPDGICDGFVSKWTSSGVCLWTKFMESENGNNYSKGYSIDLGPDEEKVFTTGLFSGTANFNPDPFTSQFEDMFILKLATVDGGYLLNLINESFDDDGILPGPHSIAVDENGCLYTTGSFIEADFDPDPVNNFYATSTGMKDIFVQKLCCCCPNEADFLNRIDKGFQVEIDPVNCRVTVTLDQFNTCHLMAYPMPDWGDSTTMQPMLSNPNGEWSHVYEQSGAYEICTTIYEFDENGDFCYSGQICTTIELNCFLYECVDVTICCTDPPVWLSEDAPDGAIFSGEFVTEDEGEFYFTPNCDDFPPPIPPYPGLRKEYEIAYSYYDAAGITHNCYFTITVDANTPPSPDCPPLDIIVCLDAEPFWHGIIYIDPAELGVGTHYLYCSFTNACASWQWDALSIPPVDRRIKVTVIAEASSYSIPGIAVCENDPAFGYHGQWIDANALGVGTHIIEFQVWICDQLIIGFFSVKVIPWSKCPCIIKPLDVSWSLISTWFEPYPPDLYAIFEPEIYHNHLTVVLGINGIFWPSGSINTIGNWNVYQAYKIKMNAPGWIELIGEIPEDKTITVTTGTNYIPVLSQDYYPAGDIFTQLGTGLIFAYDLNTELLYWPQGGIYALNVLEPGKGYLVGMSQSGLATYDPLKGGIKNHTPARPKIYEDAPWNFVKSGSTHFVAINKSALGGLEVGDFIGVFNVDGICAGMTQYENKDQNLLLVAYGNDFTVKSATGLAEGENMSFRIFRPSTNSETTASVTYDASMPNTGQYAEYGRSMITNLKTGYTSVAESRLNSIKLYPNPSRDVFKIEGYNGKANVTVFNAFGKEVFNSVMHLPAEINLSDQAKGIYVITIKTDDQIFFDKLIIY